VIDKAALRARFKAQRARLAADVRARAGQRVVETVLAYPPFARASTVSLFASFRDELPTDSLVEAMRRAGQRVLLPRVDDVPGELALCEFTSLDALERDRFGIRSPDGAPFTGPIEVLFVPGLAFGLDGSRLGYGGGYYDRLVVRPELVTALRCGLGFAEQVVERLPSEAHDLRLTHIATPERVLVCSA
jgi:5-formyltetrahydrofolate cyclo-ligase